MIRAPHKQRGFVAAMLHRMSGIALAMFLPLHFLALATALNGAKALDSFLALTRQPAVALLEWGIVVALTLHMTLGVRVLAVEFFNFREKRWPRSPFASPRCPRSVLFSRSTWAER